MPVLSEAHAGRDCDLPVRITAQLSGTGVTQGFVSPPTLDAWSLPHSINKCMNQLQSTTGKCVASTSYHYYDVSGEVEAQHTYRRVPKLVDSPLN